MPDNRRLPLFLTLVAAQLVVMLDSSILNVALPSIAEDLHLSATGTAWVLNGYYLSFGGLLLLSGRAADVLGRRRMFLAGAALLATGSVIGALAPDTPVLIAARLLQGAGAAVLSPAAMSVILARFTGAGRTRTMSWWGAASTIGGALGVTVGGVLTAGFGWHSVMIVTAVAALAVLVAGWRMLPTEERSTRRPFDAAGACLATAAAVAVVYAVLTAPQTGFSVEVAVSGGVAVAASVGFVMVERRAADPILPPSALRERRVAGGIVVNMLGGAARIACFAIVALLIQQVLQYEPAEAGLAMLPTSLTGVLVSTLLLPRVLKRFGPERVAAAGLAMLTVAHVLFAAIGPGAPYTWRVLPVLSLAAAGVAFSFTPTTLVIADGMAARNTGVGSGLASATAQIGSAIGIAVFGAVDAAARAAALGAGGTNLAAAHAGLGAAHLAAAASAGAALLVAALSFPALRQVGNPRVGHTPGVLAR